MKSLFFIMLISALTVAMCYVDDADPQSYDGDFEVDRQSALEQLLSVLQAQYVKNQGINVNDMLEEEEVDMQGGMTVLYAYYGVSCAKTLRDDVQKRSTKWAKGLCDGKKSCSGRVHTSVLKDPYVGCRKDFIVVAMCVNGKIITNRVTPEAQGKRFFLKCPY